MAINSTRDLSSVRRRLVTGKFQRHSLLYRKRYYRYREVASALTRVLCLDVGAAHFPHQKWWLFMNSGAVSWAAIDPDECSLAYTEHWPWKCDVTPFPVPVASSSELRTLYRTKQGTGSSLLQIRERDNPLYSYSSKESEYFFPISNEKIRTVAIEEIVSKFDTQSVKLLKLDTQGSEYEILSGYKRHLENGTTAVVETEVSLLDISPYINAPRLDDFMSFLRPLDFELLCLEVHGKQPTIERSRQLTRVSEADATFFLKPEIAIAAGVEVSTVLLASYITYGLFDEARYLLHRDERLKRNFVRVSL